MKQDKRYFVYPEAVFFDDKIDKKNNWTTIAYNFKKDSYIKIKQPGYKILRLIDENPGVSLPQLIKMSKENKDYIIRFLQKLIDENIITEK